MDVADNPIKWLWIRTEDGLRSGSFDKAKSKKICWLGWSFETIRNMLICWIDITKDFEILPLIKSDWEPVEVYIQYFLNYLVIPSLGNREGDLPD